MNLFLWNILLALVWAAITEQFTGVNLLIGFLLGYVILGFARVTAAEPSSYFRKLWQLLSFTAYFLKEL
ncbi:MAG: Na+/H+ antiporter subunit E, partial [Planctomycetaceae bacterium]|nr:Na+/H+ antiporter subunit E [Planctomycetaceae bacterium]